MRVLFIYSDVREGVEKYSKMVASQDYGNGMWHIGIASISAVLKQHGHDVKLLHLLSSELERDKIKRAVTVYNPDIVAYSCTTNQFLMVKEIANYVKSEFPNLISICGGVHAILAPEEVIAVDGIDIVCTGEGEYTLLMIVNSMPNLTEEKLQHIDGIWYKNESGISYFKNPMKKPIESLDELPFPDTELFDYQNTYDGVLERVNITISRGCPFDCAYCCNHALKHVLTENGGHYVRFHSPDYVIAQIKEFLRKYPNLKYCDFRDDCFTIFLKWTEEFIQKYKKEIDLPVVLISRADKLTTKIMDMLSVLKINMIRVGVETGSEKVLKSLNRTITYKQIFDVARMCQERNIKIYPFYMIGLPQETPEEFLKTAQLHAKLVYTGSVQIDSFQLAVFYPYKGTKLYEYCKQNNLLTDIQLTNYLADTTLNLPNFPREEILWLKENFVRITEHYLHGTKSTSQILELMREELR